MILPEDQARKTRCCGPEGCGRREEARLPPEERCVTQQGYHDFVSSDRNPVITCRQCGVIYEESVRGRRLMTERYCIGSLCMAWCWATDGEQFAAANPDPRQPAPLGRCGLAYEDVA